MSDATEFPAFSVETAFDDDRARVTVSGEVDAATAGQIETALNDAIERGSATIEVDLGDVGFIDSSGLRALIVSRQRAQDAGRTMRVVATTTAVDRLFELTGLAESFRP
jgi:anti-sigma B factor antagonist